MKILITAGGTREDIDTVRGITNYSTGRLGSCIADRFIEAGDAVTYICGEAAALPKQSPNLEIITIRNTVQLQEKLEQALHAAPYDCVIHAMAVSDYAPHGVVTMGSIEDSLDLSGLDSLNDSKIPSDSPYLALILKRQPKVIQRIKEIQPDTLLVGFKLLSGASEAELVQAAHKQMVQSRADYVLANDLKDIKGSVHKALLTNADGIVGRGGSKEEIAQMIYDTVGEATK
ncbi:MAG: phosphopantothenate--cysteine ligase [Defluviitaleaceae bacterium]|nr:phosphopantothenate--cysteine ligase [Defluviitaleaceae bacterium]